MPVKTFYSSDFPPNALRVNHMLKLKGVNLEYTDINMMKGEQFAEDYKAINPAMTVPTLVLDDGTVLTEVIGMLYYLDQEYPDKPLMGRTAIEQAQVLSWLHRIFNTGLLSIAEVLRNGAAPGFEDRALPGPLNIAQIPELMDRGRQKLAFFFDTMEQELQNKEFLLGDSLTQADVDLMIVCNFAAIIKNKPDAEKHATVIAHQTRVATAIEQAA